MEYYPTLIEAAVEFRIHSRILLAQREGTQLLFLLILIVGKSYEIQPEHETVPMAKGYFIQKDPRTGQYYALKGGENSKSSRSLLTLISFSEMGSKIETIEKTPRPSGLAILTTLGRT